MQRGVQRADTADIISAGRVALIAVLLAMSMFLAPAVMSATVDKATPAKELFGHAAQPADVAARAIGFYARGCLAGAVELPANGPHHQVMRPSRNRNWGHPRLVKLLERLSERASAVAGWPGLLIGDLAQPRGGPMLTGHASHQIGLDADIWLNPAPQGRYTTEQREEVSAVSMLAGDKKSVDPQIWTAGHAAVIKAAAEEKGVERIFVHPAIKKALCESAGRDRAWLAKVRPWYGHHYHFHIRMTCPPDSPGCKGQPRPSGGDGCGKELAWWFTDAPYAKPGKPVRPRPPLRLADLPKACTQVLEAK